MTKHIISSQTVQFFTAVLATGGIDLIMTWLDGEDVSWRSIALLVAGLVGIALRIKTKDSVSFR